MKESVEGEEWGPVRWVGNPCSNPLADSYRTFASVGHEQAGVPVNQAAPTLEHTIMDLLKRHVFTGAGGRLPGWAYFSDERHSPVLFSVPSDAS